MYGTPRGLMCGWKMPVRKWTYGGASGKSGGKMSSTWNMPPSQSVSAGPKIVAVHTHAFVSSTPTLVPSGASCFTRSSCCRR